MSYLEDLKQLEAQERGSTESLLARVRRLKKEAAAVDKARDYRDQRMNRGDYIGATEPDIV